MIDVIKEYLISLGWQVDQKSFDQANKAIDKVEKKLSGFGQAINSALSGVAKNKHVRQFKEWAETTAANWGKKIETFFAQSKGLIIGVAAAIGVAVVAVGAALTAVMVKFISDVARADMQVQIFARRMFTTVENARSLKAVMDAMGLKDMEDLKDVSLNPELRAQFFALRNASNGLGVGAGAEDGLKAIRAIGFEFEKTGLLMNYFWTELAGHIGYFLQGPLKDLRAFMDSVNTGFKGNLGVIAYDLGEIFGIIGKIADIALKLNPLFLFASGALKAMGDSVKDQLRPWEMLLDIINKILDAFEWLLDAPDKLGRKIAGMGSGDAGHAATAGGYSGQSPMQQMAGYLKNIQDMLRPLTDWFMHTMNIILSRLGMLQQAGSVAHDVMKHGGPTGWLSHQTAEWIMHQIMPHPGKGSVKRGAQVAGAALNYLNELGQSKLGFTVTSGNDGKHANGSLHYLNRALDIVPSGHSNWVSLAKAMLAAPGLQRLNMELTPAHYSQVLKELDRQRVNYKGRVSHQITGDWTGEHLHASLAPITQHININIHGAHDEHKTAATVHKVIKNMQAQAVHTHRSALA